MLKYTVIGQTGPEISAQQSERHETYIYRVPGHTSSPSHSNRTVVLHARTVLQDDFNNLSQRTPSYCTSSYSHSTAKTIMQSAIIR